MIKGFSVSGFRSLHGATSPTVYPLSKVSLLAGQNNSGKSNILTFALRYLNASSRDVAPPTGLDVPQTEDPTHQAFSYAIAVHEDDPVITQAIEEVDRRQLGLGAQFASVLQARALRSTEDDAIWIKFKATPNGGLSHDVEQLMDITREITRGFIGGLSNSLTQSYGGAVHGDAERVLGFLDIRSALPRVEIIETFRRADNSSPKTKTHNGAGIFAALQKLQNPEAATRKLDYERFTAINRFVQTVFEDYDSTIEVPFSLSTINIIRADSALPLEHYGTGIQQVIVIATAATLLEGCLICIEEPEVNLHPILQRKLLHYLREKTNNHYLIATHSAQMLDYENSSVFSVRRSDTSTEVLTAQTPAQVSKICVDLGYRPSDLIQTNAVVWVEGPSDRIYVRHWIDAESDGKLVEGIHYSIMFYGGKLLNALTVDDPNDIDDFISLRRLNRNVAVIIDSDRKSPDSAINATKTRIAEALDEDDSASFAWVTDGYTIENYVPELLLKSACNKLYPSNEITGSSNRWVNPLIFTDADTKRKIDKVKVARAVCSGWDKEHWAEDLRGHVHQLVTMLRAANPVNVIDPTLTTSNPPL